MTGERERKHGRIRTLIQLLSTVFLNGYAAGFAGGKLYTGAGKMICVPVLNCYSCPGALGSCPIGSLQAVLGGHRHMIAFYVLGTLMLVGTLVGRLVCGFLCPFGFIQDLLYKIPVKKIKPAPGADRYFRYIKYFILFIFVLMLPVVWINAFEIPTPFFCKYICPAGTLEGGIPHVLMNESLRKMAGALFNWKLLLLIFFVVGSVFISRFFCRYFCPLGAFYAIFNRISFYSMALDKEKCIDCKKCESICPMGVEVTKKINTGECIRCGKCKAGCPADAIRSGFMLKNTGAAEKAEDGR
ncbi:MAG: 4Fe-4S binding protein, partial [Lachnospiraceae bacterium]|nr:4Fe-4S binding protein [Lachnospiraceae bacterium]